MMENSAMEIPDTGKSVEELLQSQIREWDLARNNYLGLGSVMVRSVLLDDGSRVKVQYNPSRIISSAAKVDNESISRRPCFLCGENRPPLQKSVAFGDRYSILVNPYPIFRRHLTIPLNSHAPQYIDGKYGDMLRLSRCLADYTVFYNGPGCGASAPDHFHFQAGNRGFMPVEEEFHDFPRKLLEKKDNCTLESLEEYSRNTLFISGSNIDTLCYFLDKIYHKLQVVMKTGDEPMLNILSGFRDNSWQVFVFPRRAHRPRQFFENGPTRLLISPASVDMGGAWIIPRKEDYVRIDKDTVKDVFGQVTLVNDDWQTLKNLLCNPKSV
jgi:hypothetical protein